MSRKGRMNKGDRKASRTQEIQNLSATWLIHYFHPLQSLTSTICGGTIVWYCASGDDQRQS